MGEPLILPPEAMLEHRPAGALLIAGDGAGRDAWRPPDTSRAEDAGRPDARDIARLAERGPRFTCSPVRFTCGRQT